MAAPSRIVRWLDGHVRPLFANAGAQARRRPRLTLGLSLAGYSAVLLVAGLLAGNWAADNDLKAQARQMLTGLLGPKGVAERQTVSWEQLPDPSNLVHLEYAKLALAPFDSYGDGGSIAEIEGHIVFASPIGQLGYLSRDHELHGFAQRVPMALDALLADPISRMPSFTLGYFRTLDLLPVQTGPGAYDLYVSYQRFIAERSCFEFVIGRVRVATDASALTLDGGFEDIFVASPCMPVKDVDMAFGGMEGGGRMVLRDAETMLVSIGDHQFDGVRWPVAMAQDPDTHLGKIVEIDLGTHDARIIASGLRNPQGLLVARDGTVWETEHGPQGGDEVNIVREGANYGWPLVTYGMDYGWRPKVGWPLNPEQGRHDGYDHPAFSFVPSVGITNLIQPDPREFPLWRDHLMVASLGGYNLITGTLYLLRVEDGDDPVYAEPILIDGERLRDIISLSDGRIAILTDAHNLIFLRNEEREPTSAAPDEAEFVVVRADDVAAAEVDTTMVGFSQEEEGQALFAARCALCHTVDGTTRIGPSLDGVIGRRVGAVEGFGYSPALVDRDETWSRDRLIRFVLDPNSEIRGTTMPAVAITREEAAKIAAYLEATGAS